MRVTEFRDHVVIHLHCSHGKEGVERERLAQDPLSSLVKLQLQPSMLTSSSSAVGGRQQKQEGDSLAQHGKWWWGSKKTETKTTLPPTLPLQPTLFLSPDSCGLLSSSFFSCIKEVQKGKPNNPNYRIEKKPISM